MKQSELSGESAISIVEAGFADRLALARGRAESWLGRLREERRDLESLLDTRVSGEAEARLDSGLFNTELECRMPSLVGHGPWSSDAFWNAFDEAIKGVHAYEQKLAGLEEELRAASAQIAALRARALTPATPEPMVAPRSDLRRSPRVQLYTEVELASELGGLRGLTGNVSDSGLFIASGSLPARGALIDVALQLPEVGWVEARAVVRWGRRFDSQRPEVVPGIGVEFVQLDEPSKLALQRFIEMRTRRK